jgi:hypothetical protein
MTRSPDVPRHPRRSEDLSYDKPRTFRISDSLWREFKRRAAGDGLTASFALATMARDYASGDLDVFRVAGSSGDPTRSARISEAAWAGLKARAADEGHPPTRVLGALARDYADDLIYIHVNITSSRRS